MKHRFAQPRNVRFDLGTATKIDALSAANGLSWSDTVRLLTRIGLREQDREAARRYRQDSQPELPLLSEINGGDEHDLKVAEDAN